MAALPYGNVQLHWISSDKSYVPTDFIVTIALTGWSS